MYSYFNFNSEVVFFSNHWTHMYRLFRLTLQPSLALTWVI